MRRRSPEDQESSVGLPGTASPAALTRHPPPNRLAVSPRDHPRGFFLLSGDPTAASPPWGISPHDGPARDGDTGPSLQSRWGRQPRGVDPAPFGGSGTVPERLALPTIATTH